MEQVESVPNKISSLKYFGKAENRIRRINERMLIENDFYLAYWKNSTK